MNDIIERLAKSAGIQWKQQRYHITNTAKRVDFPPHGNVELEKFAQLIIDECCNAIAGDDHCGKFQQMISKHFVLE